MLHYLKIIGALLLTAAGIFLVIYGEIDDSPGGQLLGTVLALLGVVGIFKKKRAL